MIESFVGLMLLIGCGLFGRELLLREQASLRVTLHHIEAYRDAIGLTLGGLCLGGLYHSASTGFTERYTPVYWSAWTLSNVIGVAVGVTLCAELWSRSLIHRAVTLYRLGRWIEEAAQARVDALCWSGLALGAWRLLHPWLG